MLKWYIHYSFTTAVEVGDEKFLDYVDWHMVDTQGSTQAMVMHDRLYRLKDDVWEENTLDVHWGWICRNGEVHIATDQFVANTKKPAGAVLFKLVNMDDAYALYLKAVNAWYVLNPNNKEF